MVLGWVVVATVVSACGSGGQGTTPTPAAGEDSSDAYDLSCETMMSIHADMDQGFEGYTTPEEAVNAWITGSGGLPNGQWTHHEDDKWILVDNDGNTIGRTKVRTMTGNNNTTFATERYVSNEIEYCE